MVLQGFGAFAEVWEIARMVKYTATSSKALLKGKGVFGEPNIKFSYCSQGFGTFSEVWEIAKMVKYKNTHKGINKWITAFLGDSENGKVQEKPPQRQ